MTQDIGFTASGDLDVSSLLTFVGAGNGLVTTWYDQSGNGLNLTQATTSIMPQLVSSGVVNKANGQPFIRFYTTSSYNSINLASQMTTVGHVSAVLQLSSSGDGFILSHTSAYYWHSNAPTFLINSTYASASVQGGAGWSNGTSYSPDVMPWPTSLSVDELEPSTPGTGTAWDNIGSDRNAYHNISNGGGYCELILFPTALPTAARQSLEMNEGSYFSVGILPVSWLSFTAQVQGQDVVLQWQTATEQNSHDFTVEQSADGHSWTAQANVPAAGNSSIPQSYRYVQPNVSAGNHFFRIVETDFDGDSLISAIRVVKTGATTADFSPQSNPVYNGLLQVTVNSPVVLSLYSTDGRLIWTGRCVPGVQEIDVSALAKGLYLLSGNKQIVKVLLQ